MQKQGARVRRSSVLFVSTPGKLIYFSKHFGPNAERRLKDMMVATARLKGLLYRILRVLSLGRIQKDEFWLAVSKELSTSSK